MFNLFLTLHYFSLTQEKMNPNINSCLTFLVFEALFV